VPRRKRDERTKPVSPPPSPRASVRAAWWCACATFAALFLTYLWTLSPTVVDQDSGELVAAAHVLGIPHPTGYPLWTLLARGFDLLPLGHTSAYRVALFSAFSSAAAGAVVCWMTIAVTGALFPGIYAGLSFGLWFPTWSQAVRPEVYALGGLLFALFVLALLRWDRNRSPQNLGWMALAGGLATMHHRTALVALGPALALAFWLTRPRQVSGWIAAAGLFLAPFLFYLYLPIRAVTAPPLNWGRPDNLDRFLHHALGRQYGHFIFANDLETVISQCARLWGELLAGGGWLSVQVALIGIMLVLWGTVAWWRRRPLITASLVLGSVLLSIWVLEWGEISDSKVWFIPVGVVMALLGGIGLAEMSARWAPYRGGRYLAAAGGALVCLFLFAANWDRSDQSDVWLYRDRWAAVLAQMEENAIFLAEFDVPMFATDYLQHVEGVRKDITLLRPQDLWHEWYVSLIQDEELRDHSETLWREVSAEIGIARSNTPEFWQGSAALAHRLAGHYRGRRFVYGLHGPVTDSISTPPYFVGLSEDLVRLEFELPDLLVPAEGDRKVMAEFPKGLRLVSFDIDRFEAGTGELVGFRARWQTGSPISGEMFGVRLLPRAMEIEAGKVNKNWQRLSEKGRFVQGFPVVYGLRGLVPSPAGMFYEQEGRFIVPSNAPPGEYLVQVGYAPSYPPEYVQWADAGIGQALIVHSRPLPANGP